MEPAHSETGDCRVEPPESILVARLSMSHLVPLLEFNQYPSSSWRSCRYLNDEFPPCTTRRRVLQSFDGLIEWIDSFDHGSYLSSIDHATNVFQLYSAGLCEEAEVVTTNSTGAQLHRKTYAPHDKGEG